MQMAGQRQVVIRRAVARVLLFDRFDRVLMFHAADPSEPTRAPWWYLPGGGIDPGESPEQAARRELFEETGIEAAELGPVVLERGAVRFRFAGRDFEQDEWHVFGRLIGHAPVVGGATDPEAAAVAAHRWWAHGDLSTTPDLVYPPGLAGLVGRLLREGPPPTPWRSRGSEVSTTQDVTPAPTDRP